VSHTFTRRPCQDCGGPKGPGRGERYCDACRAKRHVPTIALDDQLAIVRAYNARGATMHGVAAEFYCSVGTVGRVLEAHGVPARPRGGQGSTRQRLSVDEQLTRAQLYGQGLSLAGVADVVGRNPSSVHASLVRYGVTMRPVGVNYTADGRYDARGARGRFAPKEKA
jgi:hypothetical protein